jgi:hypothetical protein
MEEKWRSISDFPSHEVSDQGSVRQSATKELIIPRIDFWGYKQVVLIDGEVKYHSSVAELVLDHFGTWQKGDARRVIHRNEDRSDNRVDNLRWERRIKTDKQWQAIIRGRQEMKCECGSTFQVKHLSKHRKTETHQKYLASLVKRLAPLASHFQN